MSMKVTWETKCDTCGETIYRSITLSKKTRYEYKDGKDSPAHPYFEIWTPGVPDEWVMLPLNNEIYFFCSAQCCRKWLKKAGLKEIADGLSARIPRKTTPRTH